MHGSRQRSRRARRAFVRRVLADSRGQEEVGYALLASLVAIVALVAFQAMAAGLAAAYAAWNANIQNLWVPPNPGGSP